MTSGTTTVRGAELAHATTGSGSAMIWGHGLTSSRANEDESPLIDWGRVPVQLTRYDARGHGDSSSTPEAKDYSWESLALDQLELATALGIERYLAGGASMGCGTALHAAIQAPERLDRLVLMIPPTAWETRAGQVDQWGAAAHVVSTKGVEPMITASAELPPPDPFIDDHDRLERRAAYLRSWDTDRLAQVFRGATQADLPPREAIEAITQPALILAWSGDPAHPVSTAEELDRLLPNSTVHIASTAEDLTTWTGRLADFVG